MYKYKSGQISITDFGQPMGMHLNENNRWVKKAAMIPWNEIEKIEKKAKAFINGYIRQQRNNDFFDYEIDVLQFANDLDFINDYIYDKDDKLNRE